MQYRDEFLKSKETLHGASELEKYENYDEWLHKITANENGKTLPPARVKSTLYIAKSPQSDKVLGMLDLRHELNDYLLQIGGHIGYSVVPSERKKGIATEMLKQALVKCRELGIPKVLVTCVASNVGSAKTIQKCGGVLENEVVDNNGDLLQRYWITLN